MKQPDRRSPLRAKLLRIPGESIQTEIERLWTGELIPWVLVVTFTGLLAVIEWIHWLTKSPPSPWLYSALAVIAIGYSFWRLRKARERVRQLTLGLRGERAVAEILDSLREKGARVFHDVPGDGFNVDHVVVSDRGIYAIETKTLTKAPGASVSFDPEGQILVDGRRLDRDPLAQSKSRGALACVDAEDEHRQGLPCPASCPLPRMVDRVDEEPACSGHLGAQP